MALCEGSQTQIYASARSGTSSRIGSTSLVKLLLLGSLRTCLASLDPCDNILQNVHSVHWLWIPHVAFEYLNCIRQDSHCRDVSLPCNELECDAEADGQEWAEAYIGSDYFPISRSFPHMISVRNACPLTCQACSSRKQLETIRHGLCEDGWTFADGACFKYAYGGQDGFSPFMVDWLGAERACQAGGAHLATVATRAQEHLVFHLIRQRPAHLGTNGLWAWVGLGTGLRACSHNSSNWTWIGTPQLKISDSIRHSFFPASCNHESSAMYTNTFFGGENFAFTSAASTETMRAWICSKPARIQRVTKGLCQDAGLFPILDLGACEAAAGAILGLQGPAIRTERATQPFGCYVGIPTYGGGWLNTEPATQTVGADPDLKQTLLCQSTNATGQTVTDPAIGRLGAWEGVHASDVAASFSQAVLASLLVASFLPVLMVLAVRRQDLIALKRHALFLVWSLQACVCRREAGVTDYSTIVATRLQQRRRGIANIAAVAVASFHLFELVRVCFVEESVCTSVGALPRLRLFLALVHLGSLWAASLFLALTHRIGQESSRSDLAFLFVIIVLDVAQTALVGEQALLVESRLYSQLLWRLLLGSCTSPAIALLGNLLYLIGGSTTYKMLISDGLVFTVGSTRAGLLYRQGCNQLWSQLDASTIKDLLLHFGRMSTVTDVSTAESLTGLLDELLKKQTSFHDFLLAEILLLTIVMGCLVFLHTLMSQEILKSLQLQSSEDQLLAVSQILDRLCDATCQLSSNFCICSHSPSLGAILHMSAAGQGSMEGTDFSSIIALEEDRASFKAFIYKGIKDGFKDALCLGLKSASSMRVQMQLLCARFTNIHGHPRILCGLTELQTSGHNATADSNMEPLGPLVAPRLCEECLRKQHRRGQRPPKSRGSGDAPLSDDGGGSNISSSSASSNGSERSNGSARSSGSDTKGRLVVEVTLDDTLRVVSASKAFMAFIGARLAPDRTPSLRAFLVEPETFAESMKSCMEGSSSDKRRASSPRETTINFKALHRDGKEICSQPHKAVCKMELRKSPGASSLVKLRLITVTKLPSSSDGQQL